MLVGLLVDCVLFDVMQKVLVDVCEQGGEVKGGECVDVGYMDVYYVCLVIVWMLK